MNENRLIFFLKQQSFHPTIASLFIHPFYFIRRDLFKNIKRLAPQLRGKLLDFGCGRKPYEGLFSVDQYIGIDIETTGHDHARSKVDVYYDGKHIPFDDASFDSLFCSEVLEHVFNPNEILQEINRVLKPGAKALITVPFSWNEHEAPFDYARYTSFGITDLLQKNGFRVVQLIKGGNFARVNFQLWALYFFEIFSRFKRPGYILAMIFIMPINVIGSILLLLLPNNKSLYFNNIIMAEKIGEKR
jgi:SAM-dependent methyltransferase